jgi:hypothetical protein
MHPPIDSKTSIQVRRQQPGDSNHLVASIESNNHCTNKKLFHSVAGIGTFILEFGTLSRLTGNPHYERVALRALESLWESRSKLGLVGNHIDVQTGSFQAIK